MTTLTELDDTYVALGAAEQVYGLGGEDLLTSLADGQTISSGDGLDNVSVLSNFSFVFAGLDADHVEISGTNCTVYGEGGADLLISTGSANLLYGGDGDDTFVSSGQSDVLSGGLGDDTYQVTGNATIAENPNEGRDLIVSTSLVFSLENFANIENLRLLDGAGFGVSFTGNNLDNDLYGTAGADFISGGVGADFLFGGDGNDTLQGGAGDDTYDDYQAGDTIVEELDGGYDLVVTSDNSCSLNDIANVEDLRSFAVGNATLSGNDGNNQIWTAEYSQTGISGTVTVFGYSGDDIIHIAQFSSVVDAGSGDDVVIGTGTNSFAQISYDADGVPVLGDSSPGAGNDEISGGDGNDELFGGLGADTISGGNGSDLLDGGTGADAMSGGAGADVYFVDDAGDTVIEMANDGYDTAVYASSSMQDLNFENVEKALFLGELSVVATGSAASETLSGGVTTDLIFGAGGSDTISGGRGTDQLSGGAGDDIVNGGTNADILQGGAGSDLFDFNGISDSGKTASSRDIILDFQHLLDKIDLSTIDSNTRAKSNNAFTFIGTKAFTHHAAELHYHKVNLAGSSNDRTIVEGDINGDSKTDFQIELLGLKTLSDVDFIL